MTSVGTFRWLLKKAGRAAVARGSFAVREVFLRRPEDGATRVRALTYHRFGDAERDPFCVSTQQFRDHMRHLARAGSAISLKQLEAFLAGTQVLPQDAVLVTVDDGFQSLKEIALPILRELEIPAVAFVSAGLVGLLQEDPGLHAPPENYLNWKDLEILSTHNVSIQSHGWSHRSLGFLSSEEVVEELWRSKEVLERRLGTSVTAFGYPFGTIADFSSSIAAQARKVGYRLAFTSQHGAIVREDEPLMLPRVKVEGGESLATFNSLLHGGLDAWRWVDRNLWRLQASRRGAP